MQSSPRTTHYRFAEGQSSVRLVASSATDVCAVLAVQNYSVTDTLTLQQTKKMKLDLLLVDVRCCSLQCPIAQSAADVSAGGLRMTMMRAGAVQLSVSHNTICQFWIESKKHLVE